MYGGVVVTTVKYGAEAWVISKDEQEKLNVVVVKHKRSVCVVTRMYI